MGRPAVRLGQWWTLHLVRIFRGDVRTETSPRTLSTNLYRKARALSEICFGRPAPTLTMTLRANRNRSPEADSWTYNFVEVSGHNPESSQTWCYTMFTFTKQFQITSAQGDWGGNKIRSRGDCEQQRGILIRLLSQLRPRNLPPDTLLHTCVVRISALDQFSRRTDDTSSYLCNNFAAKSMQLINPRPILCSLS